MRINNVSYNAMMLLPQQIRPGQRGESTSVPGSYHEILHFKLQVHEYRNYVKGLGTACENIKYIEDHLGEHAR